MSITMTAMTSYKRTLFSIDARDCEIDNQHRLLNSGSGAALEDADNKRKDDIL